MIVRTEENFVWKGSRQVQLVLCIPSAVAATFRESWLCAGSFVLCDGCEQWATTARRRVHLPLLNMMDM